MDNNLQQYAQQNLTLPHDVVQLPSGGIFYKNKKKSVKVGYLTAADENILLGSLSSPSKDHIILQLLRNKLYETDVRPEDLLEGDIEALMIFLRNTAFGPEYKIQTTDPNTLKRFDTTIILDELNIIKSEITPSEDGMYTVTLPKSQSTIRIRPITFGEILEINNIVDNYPPNRIPPKVTLKLTKQIMEIDGKTDKSSISVFVESMPIADSKFIRLFMEKNEPRLDLKKEVTTPSGEKVDVNIGFGVEFFRPFF
jgi:hypothetical protein